MYISDCLGNCDIQYKGTCPVLQSPGFKIIKLCIRVHYILYSESLWNKISNIFTLTIFDKVLA